MTTEKEAAEVAVEGWTAIARMFGVSSRKMQRRYRLELMDAGILFYVRRGRTRWVAAFPSSLIRWAAFKGKRRDVI